MYKCSLIGFGNIAFGYDINSSDETKAKTHYKAYLNHQKCEIDSIFDPYAKNKNEFFTDDIDNCLSSDIVSICSNTENHFEHLKLCLKKNVPMIWLEKPILHSSEYLSELQELLASSKSVVTVNYTRRYSNAFKQLKFSLENQDLKAIRINYSKTLKTNGIHLLDCLLYLLPNFKDYQILYKSSGENPSAIIQVGQIEVQIQGCDLDYHNLDFEVTTDKSRYRIVHNGNITQYEKRVENPDFPGFYKLSDEIETTTNMSPGLLMDTILDDLIKSYEEKRDPISSIRSAIDTESLAQLILGNEII